MADLRFDLDEIRSMKNRVSTLAKELTDLNNNLKESLENLRNEWQTPAGTEFFSTVDVDWEDEVREYINSLFTLEAMLQYTTEQYEGLVDRAKQIRFQ